MRILYQYKCECGRKFDEFNKVEQRKTARCECGKTARQIITAPHPITDTSFFYTGKVDDRLGERPVEGRKDFFKRMREKGYREIDRSEGEATTITMDDRIEKFCLSNTD